MDKPKKIFGIVALLFALYALFWNYPMISTYYGQGKVSFPYVIFGSWFLLIWFTRYLVNKSKNIKQEE